MENQENEGLKRELGILDVATNVVNISIASGIFLLPAIIAGILGNMSILAYILCGIMFLLVALCYAEVGSRITASGGAYIYIERAFGHFTGFMANTFFWLGVGVFVSAALINGIADMLSVAFPIFTIPVYRAMFFLVIFGFCCYINILGVKQGMTAIKIITVAKLLPLLLLVTVGLFEIHGTNLAMGSFPSFEKLGAASLILFFAFSGGETALNISGEMKNPNRTGPFGLLLGVVCIVLFYSLIQLVAQGVLGADLINHKEAPLAAVAFALFGSLGSTLLIACAVVAIFGSLNSLILLFPRVIFAGAKDGYLPAALAKIHPKYATPHWAIIAFSGFAFIVAISGGFKQLVVIATMSILLLYIGVILSLIKFRSKKYNNIPASFIVPGGLTIPIISIIILTWLLFQSTTNEIIATGIMMGLLSLIYALRYFILKRTIKKTALPDKN
jgi:APA family basic amino acid/polyamine antiporter